MKLSDFRRSATFALEEKIASLEEVAKTKELCLEKQRGREQRRHTMVHNHMAAGVQGSRGDLDEGFRGCDWTKTYREWEGWEDDEDMEADLNSLKETMSVLRKKKRKKDRMRCSGDPTTKGAAGSCCGGHDKTTERMVAFMSNRERLKCISKFREEGNAVFGKGQYGQALDLYEKALIYFEYFRSYNSKGEAVKVEAQRLKCLVNGATCFLQMHDYKKCIEYCTQALDVDERNVKGVFRRAQAHRCLGNFDDARRDLEKASNIGRDRYPSAIEAEYSLLDEAVGAYTRTSKNMARQMMGCRMK